MEEIGGAGLNNIKLKRCHVPQLTPKNEHDDLQNMAQQLEREHASTQKILFTFFDFLDFSIQPPTQKLAKTYHT